MSHIMVGLILNIVSMFCIEIIHTFSISVQKVRFTILDIAHYECG